MIMLVGFAQGILAVAPSGVGLTVALAILGVLFFVPGVVILALPQILSDSMLVNPL